LAQFLTPEWVAELDAAAREAPGLRALGRDGTFTVELRIRGGDGSDFVFHAAFTPDGTRFASGSPAGSEPEPDVVLVLDTTVAQAIRSGDANVQDALLAGALKVRGDVQGLAARAPVLAAVGDVFAPLRETGPA
jgi:hypothetical protein